MAAGMSAAGSSRFSEPPRRSGAASLVAWSLFLPDELPRPVAVLPGRRRLHASQPAENRQIRCKLVGIRNVDTRRRLGSISGRTLCLAPHVNLPEAPSRLFPSCGGLGVAADLLLCFAPGLLFGLSSGLGFGLAACLLFGFASRLRLGFTPSLLLGVSSGFGGAACLLFGLAPGLLFGLSSGFGFGGAACLLFGFAPGLLFGFAPSLLFDLLSGFGFGGAACLLLGFAPGLGLGFAPGLGLGKPCPRLRFVGVDRVALCQRLPLLRQSHLPVFALPLEHASDRTSDTAI